jgi:hypothetical protein
MHAEHPDLHVAVNRARRRQGSAFFAGDMIVNALTGPEHGQRRFVAVNPRGQIADLNEDWDASLRPAADGTWLTATRTTIRRRTMVRNDEEIPGQMPLW